MPDASDRIRAFLDKLFRLLPGYTGYADKESRRSTDKLLREHLARQLAEVKAGFDRFIADLTRQPNSLELMNPAASITKLLEKDIDRLRLADYGYAGFFSVGQVKEQQLQALYDFDLSLAQSIDALRARAAAITPDQASLKEFLNDLQQFDTTLNAREKAITTEGEAV